MLFRKLLGNVLFFPVGLVGIIVNLLSELLEYFTDFYDFKLYSPYKNFLRSFLKLDEEEEY